MCGAHGEASGAARIDTSVVGYVERITDPENADAILVMTMPQIGNYGVNNEDVCSGDQNAAGLVVREMCKQPSSWRSEQSLPAYLEQTGIVALDGVDTRAVTLYLRENPDAVGHIRPIEEVVV
jgi:carbamoyl-phosphate synthase small subunit